MRKFESCVGVAHRPAARRVAAAEMCGQFGIEDGSRNRVAAIESVGERLCCQKDGRLA